MKIKVDAYTITPSEIVAGTEGSYGSAVLECVFGEDWDGLIKKASFFTPSTSTAVLFENDTVRVPDEIMQACGEFPFVLSGHGEGKTIISVTGRITVLPTSVPSVTPPGSPTPSEMDQIYALVSRAVSATDGAAKAAADAGAAADGALLAAKNAENAEKKALDAAQRALAAAGEAGSSIVRAEIDEAGHLILTMSGGGVQDAGSVQGHAVSGEYLGTGEANDGYQDVYVGFRPSLLAISRVTLQPYIDMPTACTVFGDGISDGQDPIVKFTDEGFTVYQPSDTPAGEGLNEYGVLYRFIALAESIPDALFENGTVDRFSCTDGDAFRNDCRESSPPASFGQLMVGPGGRLFVSVLGHAPAENAYGAWLPIIDDAQLAASPDATTYSAAKIGEIASGLSRSMENMGSALSAGITAVGDRLNEKADLVNGCVRMNDYNVMGFVKFLDSEDPSLIHDAGYYAIISTDSGWAANAIPTGEYHGLLEVLPSAAGLVFQRFYASSGSYYFRSKDLIHATDWTPWARIV